MEKENREYKDSLFVDLFYSDESAVENLLSLYNALHTEKLRDTDQIRKVKIGDILYKNFRMTSPLKRKEGWSYLENISLP